MLHVLLGLQIAAAATRPLSTRDSVAIVDQARTEATQFLWVWRFYWEASEATRHAISGNIYDQDWQPRRSRNLDSIVKHRLDAAHCHPDGRDGFPRLSSAIPDARERLRAFCPTWSFASLESRDERVAIDDGLLVQLQSGIKLARAELIATFARAARALPSDAWLAGQRVRFAVDQHDQDAAARGVAECAAEMAWCMALGAYARYANGDVAIADSMFESSAAAMPLEQRCEWTNLEVLLEPNARQAYRSIPCERRDSVNARIWWLSDPLYTEPRNERRAEHFARLVMVSLRSEVEPSERWNWRVREGGMALRVTLLRYGWPSYSWWGGPAEDLSHYTYLGVGGEAVRRRGVFTTEEYSTPRFQMIPDWAAIATPWQATASMWTLGAPPGDDGTPSPAWWPPEHYARANGPLVQIGDEQAAVLRRQNDLLLAVATDLPHAGLDRSASGVITGTLIITSSPDTLRFTEMPVSLDSTAVWRAAIPQRPAIVGVEVRGSQPGATAARTRFGIEPPPPLAVMRRGEIAISPPVLVRPARPGGAPDSDPSTALSSMLGSTQLRDAQRVGLYWETYGVRDEDSVEVAVTIERRGSPSVWRRLGTTLHVADRVDGSVTVRWREPRPGFAATTFDGPVPIQGRNVSIDLSRLVPDKYAVTVSVTRSGQTASAARDFEILPP